VRLIQPATEQEVLDAFIAAEGHTRGYEGRVGRFLRYPWIVNWNWMSLLADELESVHLIRNEPSWIDIAGLDRRPGRAIEWVMSHPDDETSVTILEYNARLRQGDRPPPFILVGPPSPSPADLVVLEGNKRTVALCIGGVDVEGLSFLVGTSPAMREWHWYDD